MRFLVFQHIACEHPGLLRGLMRERGIAWDTVELDEGGSIPSLEGYNALLVFGGPMNVDEEAQFPWLTTEVQAIRDAMRRDIPYLGLCFGAQLLAKALGAPITKAPQPEVGIMPVTLTPAGQADPLLAGLPRELLVFQWHGDTFALPAGAVHLAASSVCPQQAFRHGRAYGLQFHLEVTHDMVEEWGRVPEYFASLEKLRGRGAMNWLRGEMAAQGACFHTSCATLFENFLQIIGSGGA